MNKVKFILCLILFHITLLPSTSFAEEINEEYYLKLVGDEKISDYIELVGTEMARQAWHPDYSSTHDDKDISEIVKKETNQLIEFVTNPSNFEEWKKTNFFFSINSSKTNTPCGYIW